MIKLFKTTMLALCLLSPSLMFAHSEDTPSEGSDDMYLPPTYRDVDPNRKRMPSRHDGIYFRYDYLNRWCVFSNLGSTTTLSVTITDLEGNSRFGTVSSDFPVWQIDLQSGEYFISCTSDSGTTYEGFVYI